MGSFEKCMKITSAWEGGWSDHNRDPGGKTMYGITQATLSEDLGRPASVAEIRNLSELEARRIYRKRYWDRISGDKLPPGIDLCVFDFGVNSGPDRAVRSLQAALGVTADGWVGPLTLAAIYHQPTRELVQTLCDRRLAFMKVAKDKKGKRLWPVFGKGWGNRVADIRARASRMSVGATVDAPAFLALPLDNAKAFPAPPVESAFSADQKVGFGAGLLGLAGTFASFWRENSDMLADPKFLMVAGVLTAVVAFLLCRKPKLVEQLQ
jgi:lysozyme family protein